MFTDRFKELVSTRGEMAKVEAGTGIDSGLLSKYKNGRVEPTLPNAVAIADYFDVSLDWLAGREGFERDSHKRPSPAMAPDVAQLVDDYVPLTPREKAAVRAIVSTMADGGEAKNPDVARVGEAV